MTNTPDVPTVVLVHGGFADASFWTPVVRELQARGLPVVAPPNPLRGLASDAEYVASFVNQIDGPVLLVGHSYGGAVISVAAAAADNVVGLVYVSAFILDENESFAEIFAGFPPTPLGDALRPSTYPVAEGETAVELTIAPELYQSAFAADLPEEQTSVLAVMQRPFAAIFDDRAQTAAWKTLPRGPPSRPPTTPSTPTPSGTWPGARARRRSRSKPRTRSRCRSRRRSPSSSRAPWRPPPPGRSRSERPSRAARAPSPGRGPRASETIGSHGEPGTRGRPAAAGPRGRGGADARARPAGRALRALDAAFGLADAPAPELFRTAMVVLDLLSDIAADAPVLVVLEDAHWLDGPTADVLAFVARRLESDPIVLLAAIRDGYRSALAAAGLPELRFAPLSPAAAAELVDAAARPLSTAARRQLLDEAAGNPLALIELPLAETRDPASEPGVVPLTERLELAFALASPSCRSRRGCSCWSPRSATATTSRRSCGRAARSPGRRSPSRTSCRPRRRRSSTST
jgi:pimeloyl-ACP methyl ester carboxylesterase